MRLCLCASVHICVGWLFGHLHRQTLCFGSVRLSLRGPTGAKNNVGNGPLLHLCFLSGLFPFVVSLSDGHSAGLQSSTWGAQKFGETKGTGLGHERSRNGNRVAADSRAKLSVISLAFSVSFSFTRNVVNRRHAPNQTSAQVVSTGSQSSAAQHKMLKSEAATLAGAEFTVRSGPAMLKCYPTLEACHLRSAISLCFFIFQEIKEMSHVNCDVLTQHEAHVFVGIPQKAYGKPDWLRY